VTRIRFEIIAKTGNHILAEVQGLDRDANDVTIGEAQEIIELEQKLEKLTGHRWHINMHTA